jgi:hypothetical protein
LGQPQGQVLVDLVGEIRDPHGLNHESTKNETMQKSRAQRPVVVPIRSFAFSWFRDAFPASHPVSGQLAEKPDSIPEEKTSRIHGVQRPGTLQSRVPNRGSP